MIVNYRRPKSKDTSGRTKKRKAVVFFLALMGLVLGAEGLILADTQFLPGTNGISVWNYITKINPYEGYRFWPGKEGFCKGRDPHGAILRTYVNSRAYLDLVEGRPVFSNGAIIVKEGYGNDFEPKMTVVMYKVDGYDREHHNWFWVKYGADGKVEKEGKVEGCVKCHAEAQEVDYTFSRKR